MFTSYVHIYIGHLSILITDSEHIISNTEPKVLSMGNKNIDYINDWINNVTLENEIWRGKKLREEKPLPTKRKHEYDVVNIDVIGSSCNENQRHRRCYVNK